MWRSLFCVFVLLFSSQYVSGISSLCSNITERTTLSCTTQILGNEIVDNEACKMEVYPANSQACGNMTFSPLMSNGYIGGVTLRPYIITLLHNENLTPYAINHTVLNITFSNIKWKSMRFRFQDKYKDTRNHCRVINISKAVTIDDRSVLYYDCYWTATDDRDGQSHVLDFEAEYGDGMVNRGRYYFNVPTAEMLSPVVNEEQWKPFIYIEIFPSKMRLHILPPPSELNINAYRISVMLNDESCQDKVCEVTKTTINMNNRTDDVIYDYSILGENGLYYFVVMPLHKSCVSGGKCRVVESPKIKILNEPRTLNVCIVSTFCLIVSAMFFYYLCFTYIRRRCCKDYTKAMTSEIPPPTKVLVIYSSANPVHARCVASFATYLRTELGFQVMHEGDISVNSDPYLWAQEAFSLASHIMYVVGPAEENMPNIYDKPLTPHREVDLLLLSFLKATRTSKHPKQVFNVFFEYSTGPVPVETKHDKVFFLLKDWNKLICYLSKNMLPKQIISRTEKGRCFIEELDKARKTLSAKRDEVIVTCDKIPTDKKIQL